MKKRLLAITAALMVALSSCSGTPTYENETEYSNIKELKFSSTKNIELKAGGEDSGYVRASVRNRDEFTPDDVIFISENEEVATIEYSHDALTLFLYYDITGVGDGETYVYAKAADGEVISEKIHVIVEGTEETVPETEPETIPETEPETVPETEPETVPETEPETVPETEPETIPETVPETVPETEPETVPETEPETIPETEPETLPETEPETIPETVPETVPETEPETIPETEPETIPETEPETLPETEPENVLKLVSVTSPVGRNENATLTIIGKPNTTYQINVYYSTAASTAKGLESTTSDENGNVSWTWKVGGRTKAGEHKIVISGGGEQIETSFTTTE